MEPMAHDFARRNNLMIREFNYALSRAGNSSLDAYDEICFHLTRYFRWSADLRPTLLALLYNNFSISDPKAFKIIHRLGFECTPVRVVLHAGDTATVEEVRSSRVLLKDLLPPDAVRVLGVRSRMPLYRWRVDAGLHVDRCLHYAAMEQLEAMLDGGAPMD